MWPRNMVPVNCFVDHQLFAVALQSTIHIDIITLLNVLFVLPHDQTNL